MAERMTEHDLDAAKTFDRERMGFPAWLDEKFIAEVKACWKDIKRLEAEAAELRTQIEARNI